MLVEMKAQKHLLEEQDRDLEQKKDLMRLYLGERDEARAQIHDLEASRQSERVSMTYSQVPSTNRNRTPHLL